MWNKQAKPPKFFLDFPDVVRTRETITPMGWTSYIQCRILLYSYYQFIYRPGIGFKLSTNKLCEKSGFADESHQALHHFEVPGRGLSRLATLSWRLSPSAPLIRAKVFVPRLFAAWVGSWAFLRLHRSALRSLTRVIPPLDPISSCTICVQSVLMWHVPSWLSSSEMNSVSPYNLTFPPSSS